MSVAENQPLVSEKLAEARAMLRSDLKVSRHIFQGQPSYVVHDPVSFQNHRLSLQDYSIVANLDDKLTLRQCFAQMVASGSVQASEEEAFYRFVLKLQSLGVLSLPTNNGPELYERHKAMSKKKLASLPMQLAFLKIPLARPDVFLDRTVPLVKWFFASWFIPVWLVGLFIAGGVLVARADDFLQPFNGTLTASNALTLGAVLLVLKIWHELGHGYACKIFGGRVPEMGMLLMMGMPLAYVDASAAWMFPRRRHRLVVMLGGMYFESLVAIPAVFVWAIAGPSTLIGSIAYQVVFMATAITVLFNANPLMKYDGYFILSELVGVPNLRQRAMEELFGVFNRKILGLRSVARSSANGKMRLLLMAYAMSAGVYRATVMVTLSAILATMLSLVGLVAGAMFVATTLGSNFVKFVKYLWFAAETQSVRPRALAVSVIPVVIMPLFIFAFPTPGGIRTTGIVSAEQEHIIRAATAGFVENVTARVGENIAAGEPLIRLSNPGVQLQFDTDRAELQRAELKLQAAGHRDLAKMATIRHTVHSLRYTLRHAEQDLQQLVLYSPANGSIADSLTARDQGTFVSPGDPLVTVVAGKATAKVWLTGEQMRMISPKVGDSVSVRFPGARLGTHTGIVKHIAPAAQLQMDEAAVTYLAGGDIPVNPMDGMSIEPLVQVTVGLPEQIGDVVTYRSQASLRFGRAYEPLALWAARKMIVFVQKIMMS